MDEYVQDKDRPDINGIAPKMQPIKEELILKLMGLLPYCSISCNDNIMSNVYIRASKQPKELWANHIYENSPYVMLSIMPEKGKRYYTEGEEITVELQGRSYKLDGLKFRKYTGSVNKAITKIVEFLNKVKELDSFC